MAPYNLSDFAVKELKLPKSSLSPVKQKNMNGRFLTGLFIDFWAIVWASALFVSIFKSGVQMHLTTPSLHKLWDVSHLSALGISSWLTFSFMYFFTSFYFNQGQTAGMKFARCRISMKAHDAASALKWSFFSVSLYFTMGLLFRKGSELLKASGEISAHDHLWQELMKQKEMSAPDVRTLKTEVAEDEFVAVAA
jgi:hypothetical protein